MTSTFRALTTTFRVELDDAFAHAAIARALIASYEASDEPPALSYRLHDRGVIRSDIGEQVVADPRDVAPIFELDLYGQAIARAAPGWVLHAAAIAIGGRAFVFVGPSGAGKTTLALELVSRGHRLLTEEVVWTDGRLVRGLARPLHARTSVPPSWTQLAYPMRVGDELREHHVAIPPPGTFERGPLPLAAIVRLIHGSHREPGLVPLRASEALEPLWGPTLRRDDGGLAVATETLRTAPIYRLASRTFAEALAHLEPLLK